jgi:hypothetical protein
MKESVRLLSRETVYVIGAGFSAGLGHPQTRSLPIDVWPRLDSASRRKLTETIAFHHPSFNEGRGTTFPNIEQLLTEIQVNLVAESRIRYERSFRGAHPKPRAIILIAV